MPTVYDDIAQAIATNATAAGFALAYHVDVWSGRELTADPPGFSPGPGLFAIANKAVFVGPADIEGRRSEAEIGTGAKSSFVPVHVLVRSDPNDWDGFLGLCAAVHAAIDKRPPSGYVDVQAYGSVPAIEPQDSDGCHRGRIRLEVHVRRTI